jgi:hypothetical protein
MDRRQAGGTPGKATTVLNLRKQQARKGGASFEVEFRGSRFEVPYRHHRRNSKLETRTSTIHFSHTPNATEVPPSTPICCVSR